MTAAALALGQNADGGWPYARGASRVEPTVFALLALNRQRDRASVQSAVRGLAWLARQQRPDGGWAPAPTVEESTWVTALPLLVSQLAPPARARALDWLVAQTAADRSWWYRLRQALRGKAAEAYSGWSWYPGTAAWVTPTALTILALRQAAPAHPRIQAGCDFLRSRRCRDGGWNHGASGALGYDATSYPETTGQALLALAPAPDLEPSLATAERHLSSTRSADAIAWLRLALRAHGRDPGSWPPDIHPRNLRDLALCLLAA